MTDAFRAAVAADRYTDAPNRFITVGKTQFAYREFGQRGGVPLVLLNHWGAVLDNFDPRIVDGLATAHHVIAVDYRGIGLSSGLAPVTIDEMARDTIDMIGALGVETVGSAWLLAGRLRGAGYHAESAPLGSQVDLDRYRPCRWSWY